MKKNETILENGIKGFKIGSKPSTSRSSVKKRGKVTPNEGTIASNYDARCGSSPSPQVTIAESTDGLDHDAKQKRARVKLGAEGEINLLVNKGKNQQTNLRTSAGNLRQTLQFNNETEVICSDEDSQQPRTVINNQNQPIKVKSGEAQLFGGKLTNLITNGNEANISEFDEGVQVFPGQVTNMSKTHTHVARRNQQYLSHVEATNTMQSNDRNSFCSVVSNQQLSLKGNMSKIPGLAKQTPFVNAKATFSLTGTRKNLSEAHKKMFLKENKNTAVGHSPSLTTGSPVKFSSKYSPSGSKENSQVKSAELTNMFQIKEASSFENSKMSQKVGIPQAGAETAEMNIRDGDREDATTQEQVEGTYRAQDISYSGSAKVATQALSPQTFKTEADYYEVRAQEVQIVDNNKLNLSYIDAEEEKLIDQKEQNFITASPERRYTDIDSAKSAQPQSNQAKNGLAALSTSGEDVAVLQDLKLMAQMGNSSDTEHRESPNPGQWKQGQHAFKEALLNITSAGKFSGQVTQNSKSPHIKEIIISTDVMPSRKGFQCLKKTGSPRSSFGASSVERADTADRNTQRDSRISKQDMENYRISGGLASQFMIQRSKRNGSVEGQIPKKFQQMQESAQAKRSSNHHTSGGQRRKITKMGGDLHQHARSRQPTRLLGNALSDRGAINIHATEVISKGNSVCGATVSSEDFSTQIEKNFAQKISKSQNKLCKNIGKVYNQLTLDKIQQDKKNFAEVALKNTFLPGQRLQSDKFQQFQLQKIKEKEIQEMNCKTFLRYLNRDFMTNQESSVAGQLQNQSLFSKNRMQPTDQKTNALINIKSNETELDKEALVSNLNRTATSAFAANATTGETLIQNQIEYDKPKPILQQKGKPLNKHRFRKQVMIDSVITQQKNDKFQTSNGKVRGGTTGDFRGGISNYDFALNQKMQNSGTPISNTSMQQKHTQFTQYTTTTKRDLFSADRANRGHRGRKGVIVAEERSQEEQSPQQSPLAVDDARSQEAAHDQSREVRADQLGLYSAMAQKGPKSGRTGQPTKPLHKLPINRPLQPFGQHSNQQIHYTHDPSTHPERQMVYKKNSLITLEDSKSISNNDQQISVPHQLFDKSAKSIHTDKYMLAANLQFSQVDQDLGQLHNQIDVLDYDEEENILNESQQEVPQGQSIMSKKQISIFDTQNKQKTKSIIKQVRRPLGKQLTAKVQGITQTPGGGSGAETPIKEKAKRMRMSQFNQTNIVKRSQSPVNINTKGKFRQKLMTHIKNDRHQSYDHLQTNYEVSSVSDYCPLDSQSPEVTFQNELANQLSNQIDILRMQPIQEEDNDDQDSPSKDKNKAVNQIAQMHKEIKIMNQVCQRLVTASDEYPALYLDQPQDIELTPGVCLFYRFQLQALPSPLKFDVKYHDGVNPYQSNLEVLLSTVDKNPDSINHEVKFGAKTVYFLQSDKIGSTSTANIQKDADNKNGTSSKNGSSLIASNEEATFKDRFLYVCLSSFSGCSITLSIKTIVSRQTLNKRKLDEFKKQRERDYEYAQNAFTMKDSYYREMIQLEEERLRMVQEHRDFIKKEGFGMYYPDLEKTLQKIDDKKERTIENREKYEDICDFDRKKSVFFLQKQIHLQRIRNNQFMAARKRYSAIYYSTNFIKFIKTIHILKTVQGALQKRKWEIKKNQCASFMAIFLLIKQMRRRRRRGETLDIRIQHQCKNIISILGTAMHPVKEQNALDVLKTFLISWGTYDNLITKFQKKFKGIKLIISKVEDHFDIKQRRAGILKDTIWSNEKSRLRDYLLLKKKGVLETAAFAKLPQSEIYKDLIITIYMSRQKLDSILRFMEWYCNSKEVLLERDSSYQITKKYTSYHTKIPVFKQLLKITDAFLNKGLEKEKYLTKISREVKKKGVAARPKKKKESTVKDNALAIGALFKVALGTNLQKELEKYGIFTMPVYKLIQEGKNNLILGLITRAANLKEKEVESFKTEFQAINCGPKQSDGQVNENEQEQKNHGQIPWDFFGVNKDTEILNAPSIEMEQDKTIQKSN